MIRAIKIKSYSNRFVSRLTGLNNHFGYLVAGGKGGFVVEHLTNKKCSLYRTFALAESAGWFRNQEEDSTPDDTNGVYRSGKNIWVGTNGIGVLVFNTERQSWSRYDLKPLGTPGDHAVVTYAEEEFVFVMRGEFPLALLHVYSVNHDKWLMLKSVSTSHILKYGHTTGIVQVNVNHKLNVKDGYLPIDWTFMGLDISLLRSRQVYTFQLDFSESKTVFEVSKSDVQKAFL